MIVQPLKVKHMNKAYMLLGILLLGSLAFAIEGASVSTEDERGKWLNASAGNATTEGGNVSGVDISGSYSTEKWAAFFGSVSTGIVLADSAGTQVYNWTYSAESGEVCLSTDANFAWSSANTTTATEVDSAFGFAGTDADSANITLDQTCTVDLLQATVSGTPAVTLLSNYQTCVIEDATSPTKNDLAFCVDIASGTNYNSESVDYEIMVPTNDTAGATETYYFFVELI